MGIKEKLKKDPRIKQLVINFITPKRNPRPRWYVRCFINRFFHHKGKAAVIRRQSRIDVFPWNKFELGAHSTIESFATINNGSGDIILGNKIRIGIGSVVIGPVVMESGSGLGQHVFISGFNHGYKNGEQNSSTQPLDIRPTIIGEDSHIGANAVVVAGITIGKRCQIGAGSVVTKNIPDYSIAVGNPAKIIKRYNLSTKKWERI